MRLIALLLSLALVQASAVLPPTRGQLLGVFGAYFEALRTQAGIPGLAAAIVGDSDLIWEQGFGYQDLGRAIFTRTDTPFHFDGVTQVVTAALTLRCAEEGRLQLDTPIGTYDPQAPEPGATIRQVLSHTSGSAGNPIFSYNVARLESLKVVVERCNGQSFRRLVGNLIERDAMADSMPGPDAAQPTLPAYDLATPAQAERYRAILSRLAVPYAVGAQGTSGSHYETATLRAAGGLISTVRDYAKFDLALRQGILLGGDMLAAAWNPPVAANGRALPHGMGWFVQSYNGEPVVWQFGVGVNASSSLVITMPARNITLVLVANSDGLAKPASLLAGDVTVSPFARVFLGLIK